MILPVADQVGRLGPAALARLWAAALLGLLLVSWPLWVPGTLLAGPDFPAVPLVNLAEPLAAVVEIASLLALLAGLLVVLTRPQARWPFVLVLLGLAGQFLINQHRLQAWAYQGWLYALIFACLPAPAARRWVMALTISIYAYSSLGKFDQQFIHTVGPDLIATLVPGIARGASPDVLRAAVIALPVAELVIAILLAGERTRRAAGLAAIAMHGTLVLILGPWGLGHSAAVILWNLFLGVQAWLLFVRRSARETVGASAGEDAGKKLDRDADQDRGRDADQDRDHAEQAGWQVPPAVRGAVPWVARCVVLLALGLPLLERHGYWDHWLSWSLYSPHTSRVDIQVHRTATERLPAGAAAHLVPTDEQDGWYDLATDRWSLAELNVPVYPQARFQLGVALAVAERLQSPRAIRIKIRGVADRRTGRREELWLIGQEPIQRAAGQYWLLPPP